MSEERWTDSRFELAHRPSKFCESCDKEKDQTCLWCETPFCAPCYMVHECSGHPQEAELCMRCGHLIEFDSEKPTYISGDPYCKKCSDKQQAKEGN
jgi:hypothetical protein